MCQNCAKYDFTLKPFLKKIHNIQCLVSGLPAVAVLKIDVCLLKVHKLSKIESVPI